MAGLYPCDGNPLMGGIVANVLSESSFLLFWTWGMWAAVRFLREGRFLWLPLACLRSARLPLTS